MCTSKYNIAFQGCPWVMVLKSPQVIFPVRKSLGTSVGVLHCTITWLKNWLFSPLRSLCKPLPTDLCFRGSIFSQHNPTIIMIGETHARSGSSTVTAPVPHRHGGPRSCQVLFKATPQLTQAMPTGMFQYAKEEPLWPPAGSGVHVCALEQSVINPDSLQPMV